MQYLLSNNLRIVGCLHLEGAVIGPQVNRVGDVCTSSLINLDKGQSVNKPADRLPGHVLYEPSLPTQGPRY